MAVSIGFDIYAKDRASKTFRSVGDSAKHSEGAMSSLGGTLKKLAGAFVAFEGAKMAVNAITDMAKAAIDDQQSSMLMAKGLQNSAHATKQQIAATEDWITKQGQAYGVADDDLRPALTRLATATHSVSKAQRLASLAMDISAGTGKSLKTVTEALMKAQNGSVGGLSRLGAKTKDAAGHTMTLQAITKSLAKTYGGDAATKAGTFAGKVDRLKLAFSEAKESVGYALLPALSRLMDFVVKVGIPSIAKLASFLHDKLGPPLRAIRDVIANDVMPVFDRFFNHEGPSSMAKFAGPIAKVRSSFTDLMTAVRPIIASLAATIRAHWGPITAWAHKNFGQVKDIIVGMLKLIAAIWRREAQAITFIWKHWGKDITAVVVRVFAAIGPAISGGLRAVRGIIKVITALINGDWRGAWNGVKMIFSGVMQSIGATTKLAMAALKAVFSAGLHGVVALAKKLPGWILGALGNLGSLLFNAGKAVIQGLINGIESMVGSLTSKLHSITSLIPLHKGPPAKDRILLQPAGVAIMQGLIDGLTKGEPLLKTALSKITGYVSAMGSKLSDLLSQRQGVVDSFKGFTTSVFATDLSTQNDDGSTTPATVADMLAYQQAQQAKAAQTRSDVSRLLRAGLSKSLIAQMQQAGESGLAQLHTLAGASPAQIRALNRADAATSADLSAAGFAAGNALYGSQISATQNNIDLAKRIAQALAHELHQHAKDGEIHIHLEGQTLVESIRKHQRKQGKKATV